MDEKNNHTYNSKNCKNEECIELRNLKYKTMLLNGVVLEETKKSDELTNLVNFLENEKNNNKIDNWIKLNKTLKIEKLKNYAKKYKIKNNLTDEEEDNLNYFFIDCLDRKKLQKVKDVVYDKMTGEIKEIPTLFYNKTLNKFTLKNISKNHISTTKFLTPKKKNINTTTHKNINTNIPITICNDEI